MSDIPDTVPDDPKEPKVDLANDPRFTFKDMPIHLSEGISAGMSEHKKTGEQVPTVTQTVRTKEGLCCIAHPMDLEGLDSLVKTLLRIRQVVITLRVQALKKDWETKPPTQTTMDKQTAQRLERGGYKTTLAAYRAGPKAILAVRGITKGAVKKLDDWFRSHEIAWSEPEDNPIDPRNDAGE